jgi:hypothetical protein
MLKRSLSPAKKGRTTVFLNRWQQFHLRIFPLCKNKRCDKWKSAFITVLIGANLGNIILVLLNLALFGYFSSIEINI